VQNRAYNALLFIYPRLDVPHHQATLLQGLWQIAEILPRHMSDNQR
jgi:hypothetical protein